MQVVRLPKNFGLTKALSLGWRAADDEYVLFLDDHTWVEQETIGLLADALEANPDAAAVCPLLVDDQGRPAPQLSSLPPTGEWRPAEPVGNDPFAVQYPRGAALMARVFFIKAIREIDARYGQFGSDADLAAEIRRASRRSCWCPPPRSGIAARAPIVPSSAPISCRPARSSWANTTVSRAASRPASPASWVHSPASGSANFAIP